MTAAVPPPDGMYDVRASGVRETWVAGRLVAVLHWRRASSAERKVWEVARLPQFGSYPEKPGRKAL